MNRSREEMLALAERCEQAAKAFSALGYTAQFGAISEAANLEWGGTAIGISPTRFIASLHERAAALRTARKGE